MKQKGSIMIDKPIIFSAPMVQALLDGRKTQTRRLLKPNGVAKVYGYTHLRLDVLDGALWWWDGEHDRAGASQKMPYTIGDRLWVREGHMRYEDGQVCAPHYLADRPRPSISDRHDAELLRRYPSIHMPRWASRLTLIVTDVRVQRLQDISEADAVAEGCLLQINTHCGPMVNCYGPDCPTDPIRNCNKHGCWGVREDFASLWNSLHGPEAWDANPWIVALTFTVRCGNIDRKEANHD